MSDVRQYIPFSISYGFHLCTLHCLAFTALIVGTAIIDFSVFPFSVFKLFCSVLILCMVMQMRRHFFLILHFTPHETWPCCAPQPHTVVSASTFVRYFSSTFEFHFHYAQFVCCRLLSNRIVVLRQHIVPSIRFQFCLIFHFVFCFMARDASALNEIVRITAGVRWVVWTCIFVFAFYTLWLRCRCRWIDVIFGPKQPATINKLRVCCACSEYSNNSIRIGRIANAERIQVCCYLHELVSIAEHISPEAENEVLSAREKKSMKLDVRFGKKETVATGGNTSPMCV